MQDGNKWRMTSCQSTILLQSCVSLLTSWFLLKLQSALLSENRCSAGHLRGKGVSARKHKFSMQQWQDKKEETKLTSHGYITLLHPQWDFIHKLFTPIDQNIFFSVLIWLYVQCWCNRPAIYWVLMERMKERAAGLHDNIFRRSRNKNFTDS